MCVISSVLLLCAEDKLYGRINVDPVQNLGSSFLLNVEKVFLCSGKDGYIPKYNPDSLEFGCVAETPNLQYSFKILVRVLSASVPLPLLLLPTCKCVPI